MVALHDARGPIRPSSAWAPKKEGLGVGDTVTVVAGPIHVGEKGEVERFDSASVKSGQYAYEVRLQSGVD